MTKVTVSSKEFHTFILSILNVDRSGVSLKLHRDYIEALVLSEDNSSIILYTKLNIIEQCGVEDEMVIHIKDLTKFQRLLDMNDGETFTFMIKNNHVYFENSMVKGAKFMLADRPSRVVNAKVNVQWFNSFEKTSRMNIDKGTIKKIVQCSSFTSDDANKVYLYQDNQKKYRKIQESEVGTHVFDSLSNEFREAISTDEVAEWIEYEVPSVVAEINDRTKSNLDNMSIYIGQLESGTMEGKVIINVGTLSRLFLSDEMVLETSFIGQGVSRTEIVFLSFTNDNVSVRYLLNTLRS